MVKVEKVKEKVEANRRRMESFRDLKESEMENLLASLPKEVLEKLKEKEIVDFLRILLDEGVYELFQKKEARKVLENKRMMDFLLGDEGRTFLNSLVKKLDNDAEDNDKKLDNDAEDNDKKLDNDAEDNDKKLDNDAEDNDAEIKNPKNESREIKEEEVAKSAAEEKKGYWEGIVKDYLNVAVNVFDHVLATGYVKMYTNLSLGESDSIVQFKKSIIENGSLSPEAKKILEKLLKGEGPLFDILQCEEVLNLVICGALTSSRFLETIIQDLPTFSSSSNTVNKTVYVRQNDDGDITLLEYDCVQNHNVLTEKK